MPDHTPQFTQPQLPFDEVHFIALSEYCIDVTGQQYGRLTPLGPIGWTTEKKRCPIWLCRCDCGNTTQATTKTLRRGIKKSCGCLRQEIARNKATKHGMCHGLHYYTWTNMIRRCMYPASKQYQDYGGRGIKVCDEWLRSFQSYYDHVTSLPNYGKSACTLDRIDNSGNYEPGNMRWATYIQQARNRRSLHHETFNGKTQCVAAWEQELAFPKGLISKRLRRGWTIEEAITIPLGERR